MNLFNCGTEGETAWLRFTLVAASSLIVILGPNMIATDDCDPSATTSIQDYERLIHL